MTIELDQPKDLMKEWIRRDNGYAAATLFFPERSELSQKAGVK